MTRLGFSKLLLLPCVPLALGVASSACSDDGPSNTSVTTATTGDGDGDGDGDTTTDAGDGDGDAGDGDGDAGDGDGDTGPGECQDGAEQCTEEGHQSCNGGQWEDDPCPDETFCNADSGSCDPCACTPGETGECLDSDNIESCSEDCSGYEPLACEDAICLDGACVDLLCAPNAEECTDGDSFHTCNDSGTEWGAEQDCESDEICAEGSCINACLYAELTKSNLGCEFWAVDMSNYPPRHLYTYAISIANPSYDDVATVRIWDKRSGVETAIIEGTVDPRDTAVFNVSGSHGPFTSYYDGLDAGFQDSGIGLGTAFRVETDVPVVATQFNPIGGAFYSTNSIDASLLLPAHALGEDYVHLSWARGYGLGSELNVLVTEDDTTVTVTPNVDTPAGINGLPAMTAGQPTELVLDAYDYIQIGIQDQNLGIDITATSGSIITSDKPVAVFGGHSCANVPGEEVNWCDHVEEQVFPLETWGQNYVASRNPQRGDEAMRWRIIASEDDTVVDFEPSVSLGSQVILDAGQLVEFDEHQDFFVAADKPILMAGYAFGCMANPPSDTCVGDPYMTMMVPVEQYLDDYVFLVDDSYTEDFAKLVRPAGAEITVDCLGVVPEDRWTPIGDTDWEWATIDMNPGEGNCQPGTNQATGTEPFGLLVSGQAPRASYGYPGGLGLQSINPQ